MMYALFENCIGLMQTFLDSPVTFLLTGRDSNKFDAGKDTFQFYLCKDPHSRLYMYHASEFTFFN